VLILIAFLLGALIGWRRAKRRGGDRFDGLQYAAVHGILFALLALVAIVILQRLGAL
jgi:hypothetical protein